jgi:glycosyltransferase involved in cell wall biosynthesis
MGKAVLMIAFHFPPAAMGSGHLRTVGFARHLPALGWEPIVLSAREFAYSRTAPLKGDSIPDGCVVSRSFGLDARRHFGVAGKYPGFLAQPDRWITWWPAAVLQGLRLIRHHDVRAIWSTYPIMTAHCIARTLSRITKLPWIADFRDPVTSSVSSENPHALVSQHRWEPRVLHDASRSVFTTQGALRDYAYRYPEIYQQSRLVVIQNGYDESAFIGLPDAPPPVADRPLVFVHSGLLYPDGRNPVPFFSALANLKNAGVINGDSVSVVLRNSGSEAQYAKEIRRLGIEDMVTLAPQVSNRNALIEQSRADALLLFQGELYDRQIPAKVYEYLKIGRPIFALVGQRGETAALLRECGGAELVPLDDVSQIEQHFDAFIRKVREGCASIVGRVSVGQYSRESGARSLARLLNEVIC